MNEFDFPKVYCPMCQNEAEREEVTPDEPANVLAISYRCKNPECKMDIWATQEPLIKD